jgi:hypothetical protein
MNMFLFDGYLIKRDFDIHGNHDLFEQVSDEKGKHYKIYYKKED